MARMGEIFETKAFDLDGSYNVFLLQYKIHKLKNVTAIVNYNDELLTHPNQIGKDIAQNAGPDYQRMCKERIQRVGGLPLLQMFKMSGGELSCQYVFHIICTFLLEGGTYEDEAFLQMMEQVYNGLIENAKLCDIESIAIPIPQLSDTIRQELLLVALFKCLINGCGHRRHNPKEIIIVDQSVSSLIALSTLIGQNEIKSEKGHVVLITDLDEGMVASGLRNKMVLPDIYPTVKVSSGSEGESNHSDTDSYEEITPGIKSPKSVGNPKTFFKSMSLPLWKKKKGKNKQIKSQRSVEEKKTSAENPNKKTSKENTSQDKPVTDPPITYKTHGFNVNGVCDIFIRVGDITKFQGQAIINDTDNHLMHTAPSSQKIANAAGPDLKMCCHEYIKIHGPLLLGTAVATPLGYLNYRCVINVATMDMEETGKMKRNPKEPKVLLGSAGSMKHTSDSIQAEGDDLHEAYNNMFEKAEQQKTGSLVLAPLGRDAAPGYTTEVIARTAVRAVVNYVAMHNKQIVRKITFMVQDDINLIMALSVMFHQELIKSRIGTSVFVTRLG